MRNCRTITNKGRVHGKNHLALKYSSKCTDKTSQVHEIMLTPDQCSGLLKIYFSQTLFPEFWSTPDIMRVAKENIWITLELTRKKGGK